MDIRLSGIRHVIIDHMRNSGYIDSPGSDVSCHKDTESAVFKTIKRLLSLALRQVSLQRGSLETGLCQLLRQIFRFEFGTGKNQRGLNMRQLEQMYEQFCLLTLFDGIHLVSDTLDRTSVINLHCYRIAEDILGKMPNFTRHCCRENQGLPFLGDLPQYSPNIGKKSLVEHVIGFIKDQGLNMT